MYKILLADDYPVFRKTIKRLPYFKTTDEFEVAYEASDGEEALSLLSQHDIDLVITDIKMPKMTGLELLSAICEKYPSCPVILLSEYTEFEYARQGLILGAFDYIVKPITNEGLISVLERIKPKLESNSNSLSVYHDLESVFLSASQHSDSVSVLTDDFLLNASSYCESENIPLCTFLCSCADRADKYFSEKEPWCSNILPSSELLKERLKTQETNGEQIAVFRDYIIKVSESFDYYVGVNHSDLINKAKNYILSHPYDNLSLPELSGACYVNSTYLSHTFKTETGTTIVDFITHYKTDMARKQLTETDLPIAEIAFKLGYNDTKYFGKIYKSIYGCTPAEYRKKGVCNVF